VILRGRARLYWRHVFRVVIAQFDGSTTMRAPPLAAGLLAATLRREPELGELAIRVLAARREPEAAAALVAEADVAGISLYTWNERYALEVARRARERNRGLWIVAGGPSVPRRPEASAAFLARHPWVDALVLGEGERAFVDIVRARRAGGELAAIPSVVTRAAAGPGRPRLAGAAFAGVGSPYLDGTFDDMVAAGEIAPIGAAVVETNRGCPFACTFCDWGQATQARIHELPGERVTGELTWLAERGVAYLYIVDANFGIRRRDVEITRTIGELARAHGAPRFVFFHLTKNATARNLRTVEVLREHGVATQVALSMQDFDPDVLAAIRRDNIRPADALELRERCHGRGIPTHNELMLGLPAQTAASFRRSMSAAITPFPDDSFFLYPTRVLDNAELAEPGYLARHGIATRLVPALPADPDADPFVVEHEQLVVATATMPNPAWRDAFAFGFLLAALWNQRILQTTLHVMQFTLAIPAATLVDALLAAATPRLSAIRTELARFGEAISEARATTLAVDGWGPRRREPVDAVCARVLDDPAAFCAEAADVAAAIAGDGCAALIRDAVAWDALPLADAGCAELAHDWFAYAATMGERVPPTPSPTRARWTAWPAPIERTGRLDVFLGLGWAKQPRGVLERVP
jgi:radical SAM superfamily enzyme YgiQ (UPF0313 family)